MVGCFLLETPHPRDGTTDYGTVKGDELKFKWYRLASGV